MDAGRITRLCDVAVDADFPGWHASVSDSGHWYAVRVDPGAVWRRDDPQPMTLDAAGEAALRALLAGEAS